MIAIGQAEHARAPIGASFQPAGGAIVRAISQCESRGRFSAALHMVGGAFSPVGREIRVGMQKEQPVAACSVGAGGELRAATAGAGDPRRAGVPGNARRSIVGAAIRDNHLTDQPQLKPRHQGLKTLRQVAGGVQCGNDDRERCGHFFSLSGNRMARNRAGVNAFERNQTKDPSHALDLRNPEERP